MVEHFLADGESLGSFFPRVLACGMVGRAAGPRILERGRRLGVREAEVLPEPHASAQGHHLGVEEAVALREPRHPQLAEGEAARRMMQGSLPPC